MRSVFARQYTFVLMLLFMSVMIAGISFVTASSTYISSLQQESLSKNAGIVSNLISSSILERGQATGELRMYLVGYSQISDTHILVCDTNGQIVLCSDAHYCDVHTGKYVSEAFTQNVMQNEKYVEQSTLNGIYDTNYNIAACSMILDEPIGFVIVAAQASDVSGLTGAFIKIFMIVSGIVLFISFVSAYAVTKRMTNPLKAMARNAQNYARGDFSTRVPVSPNFDDEISILCHDFNAMADSLQELEELRDGFIANVSHELRTPMTVIQGYVDGILDGTIPYENQAEYLKTIRSETLRLSRLVARMLDISNIQSGNVTYSRQPVNVSEMMRQVILGFEKRIDDKKLEVEFSIPEDDVTVSFDPDSLTQILTNLTDNAVKFTPVNGLLSIALSQRGPKAFVSVTNSGAGIAPNDLPFLFDRFYKTDKSRSNDKSGLGLGLFIVKSIIQSHNESIQVTSENGLTTFTFSLTLSR